MSRVFANALRLATIAVFVAVGVLAIRTLHPSPRERPAKPRPSEYDVATAINGPAAEVAVRGFVFDGPGGQGLRLCQGLRNSTPPSCIGPYLDLDGVDAGNFSFRFGRTKVGPVRWVEEPVAIRGSVEGTKFRVSVVLND